MSWCVLVRKLCSGGGAVSHRVTVRRWVTVKTDEVWFGDGRQWFTRPAPCTGSSPPWLRCCTSRISPVSQTCCHSHCLILFTFLQHGGWVSRVNSDVSKVGVARGRVKARGPAAAAESVFIQWGASEWSSLHSHQPTSITMAPQYWPFRLSSDRLVSLQQWSGFWYTMVLTEGRFESSIYTRHIDLVVWISFERS